MSKDIIRNLLDKKVELQQRINAIEADFSKGLHKILQNKPAKN